MLLYIAELLWVISAQLNALLGEGNFPLPDPWEIHEQEKGTQRHASRKSQRSAASGASGRPALPGDPQAPGSAPTPGEPSSH